MTQNDELTEFEIDLLRELNGEDRGLIGGAGIMAAAKYLAGKGFVSKTMKPSGLHYEINDAGRALLAQSAQPKKGATGAEE
jgi:hypothetical protein